MPVTDSSKIAYKNIRDGEHCGRYEAAVYDMIEQLGICCRHRLLEAMQQAHTAAPKTQRIRKTPWDKGNCWPRVTGLVKIGIVIDMGLHSGPWNDEEISVNLIRVRGCMDPLPEGWEKVEQENPKPAIAKKTFCEKTIEQAFAKVGRAAVSAAARQLANHKHRKAKTESQQQMQINF